MFVAERRQQMIVLNNNEKEKWIDKHVERENAVARKRVEDAETVINHEQEDMRSAQRKG
jgi:hypothetical protein